MRKCLKWLCLSRILAAGEAMAVVTFFAALAGENFGISPSDLMRGCVALIPALAIAALLVLVIERWLGRMITAIFAFTLTIIAYVCIVAWSGISMDDMAFALTAFAPVIIPVIVVVSISLECWNRDNPAVSRTVIWVLSWLIAFVSVGIALNP